MKSNRYLFMAMIISLIIMSACSDKKTTEAAGPAPSTVKEVAVTITGTQPLVVGPGGQLQFTSTVFGTDGAEHSNQGVTWDRISHLGGSFATGTTIDSSGKLTVAQGETTQLITVVAKSNADPTKSGSLTVSTNTSNPPPPITNMRVTIEADDDAAIKGDTIQFYAMVWDGYEIAPYQNITWSVSNNVPATTISQTGLLSVSNSEPDFAYLTVRAAYSLATSVYAETTVMVYPTGIQNVENGVYLSNWIEWDDDTEKGYVDVEIRRTTPITSVSVKVNNVTVQSTGYYETGGEDGYYWYDGEFLYTSPFIPGQTYTIALTVNGVTTSGSSVYVYTPTLTEPLTFNHAITNTFRWTLGSSSVIQGIDIYGYAESYYDYFSIIDEGFISPSLRSYVVPAYSVPANWYTLWIGLFEANYTISGKTIFVCAEEYYRSYPDNGAIGISRKDRVKKLQRLIRGSK